MKKLKRNRGARLNVSQVVTFVARKTISWPAVRGYDCRHAAAVDEMAVRALTTLTAAAVVLSFFLALGRYPLFDVDEGAFSEATLEMLQGGDLLRTTLNGAPRYDKPILVYWLQAASVRLFGVTEWAFRLPSAVSATLWGLLIFFFARRYYGAATALLATAAMATSIAVCIIARVATADALLNLLLAAAMFAAWLHLDTGKRGWLLASFAASGLGFLAKGPVAVLIPFAVTLIFCLLRRDFATWRRAALDPLGLAIFALIALPWYAVTVYRDGWGFVEGFFLRHNLQRFAGPLQGHSGSFLYYVPVLIAATVPFTAWLVLAFVRVREIWRNDLQLYLFLWFGFVAVFFSLAGTKLPHYLIYGLTGLFVVMAAQARASRSHFWTLLPVALLFLALFCLPWALDWGAQRVRDPFYAQAFADLAGRLQQGYMGFAASAALVTLGLMVEPVLDLRIKIVAMAAVAVTAVAGFIMPAAAASLQGPVKQAALFARERGYDVVMWRLNTPSFSVYYGRPTPTTREPRPGEVVLTKTSELGASGRPFVSLYSNRGISLARMSE